MGRLVFGPLSDCCRQAKKKLSMVPLMCVGLAAEVVMAVLFNLRPQWFSEPILVVLFSLVLLSYGGVKSIIGPWFVENYGAENLGSVLGLHSIGYGLGAAIFPVLVAHTSEHIWSIVCCVTYVVGIVAAIVVQPLSRGPSAEVVVETQPLLDPVQ